MLNKMIDSRTQWIQKLTIAASIALFAPIVAFACPGVISAEIVQPQAKSSDALLQKQIVIDAYVFEQHKEDLAKQDIQVTNTGVVGDMVEIGILEYTDEKAGYLYDIFGTELVKVVEGQQAVLFGSPVATTEGSSIAVGTTSETSDVLLQKQSEIDAYVFEQHKDELAKQGIQVTNTGPVGDKVEIGILDYTDEKANYLYSLFGTELVKVVEGQQAVLLDAPLTSTATVNEAGSSMSQYVPWIIALAVVVLGAFALFSRKLRVSRK
jgi:arginine repressor